MNTKETTANTPIRSSQWDWQSFELTVQRLIDTNHPDIPFDKVDVLIERIITWALASEEIRNRFGPFALARRCCNGQTLRGFMKGL